MQEPTLMWIGWIVLGTHRIVGTQFAQLQGIANMLMDSATNLDQSAERAFRVRGRREQQDAVTNIRNGEDAFADRTGRIAAFQRNRRHHQMRERVHQDVRQAGESHASMPCVPRPKSDGLVPALRLA